MSDPIFSNNNHTVLLPSSENSTDTPLVSIVAHSASSGSSTSISKLPLLAVNLTTADRIQVDCSLDGVFHILKAEGGWGQCTLQFLDAITTCNDSDSVESALDRYRKLRKRSEGTVVDVKIQTKSHKVTFSGYLLSCSAEISKQRDGIATLAVSYTLLGDIME